MWQQRVTVGCEGGREAEGDKVLQKEAFSYAEEKFEELTEVLMKRSAKMPSSVTIAEVVSEELQGMKLDPRVRMPPPAEVRSSGRQFKKFQFSVLYFISFYHIYS